jgi:type I restriction enzyme, S subunit
MEVKTGYKQTEVGVIPEEWDASRVCEFASVITGGTPRTEVQAYWNGGYPWVTPTDITGQRDMWTSDRMISESGLRSIRQLPANSVLVTCIASIGKNAILRSVGGCNQQINAVVPQQEHSPEFLYYTLENSKQYLLANAGMTATRIISKAAFEQLKFPMPPPTEQRAIAETLSDVDALLGGLDRLIVKKRDLKQAAMQQLLTGKTRLPGFGSRTSSRNRSAFGEFPSDWELIPLSRVSAFITKGSTPTTYGFHWVNSGILFLRSECVSEQGLDLSVSMFITREAHQLLSRSEVKAGDILMTITGNVGRVVLLSKEFAASNINQHIARIRITDNRIVTSFIFHFLSQPLVRQYYNQITTGQAYPQISLAQVRDTILPMPPATE